MFRNLFFKRKTLLIIIRLLPVPPFLGRESSVLALPFCVWLRVYVCVCTLVCVRVAACMCTCMCAYECLHVCFYVCLYVCICACVRACMCPYGCVYVCFDVSEALPQRRQSTHKRPFFY